MGSDERIGPLAWQMYAQIVVGIFLLAFAYFIGRDHVRLVLLGVHTRGKLVGYQEQRLAGSSGSTFWDSAYMPVVEFQIAAQTVRFRDWMGSNFRVPMGGSVPIVYDPHHPANAMIESTSLELGSLGAHDGGWPALDHRRSQMPVQVRAD